MVNVMHFDDLAIIDYASTGYITNISKAGQRYMLLALINKSLPFLIAALVTIFKKTQNEYHVEVDNKIYDGRYSFILAENCFVGDFERYKDYEAKKNEGSIRLRLVSTESRLEVVRTILGMRKYNLDSYKKLTTSVIGKTVKISHKDGSNMLIGFKGEFKEMKEFNISIIEQAFAYILPKGLG
jgi:diacylglycerol kinase family enzyme